MSAFLDALRSGRVLLMDGAMGTELLRAGVSPDEGLEWCNIARPELVRSIHEGYVQAGADVLLTNTFQANPVTLARQGRAAHCDEIIAAGIRQARGVSAEAWVLGDVGPFDPAAVHPEALARAFRARGGERGVDGLLLETWSEPMVLSLAKTMAQAASLPVLVSFTFRTDEQGKPRTWSGHSPEHIARLAAACGVAALGVNCGKEQDMAQLAQTLRHYRRATALPLFARPNAGTPRRVAECWVYPQSPEAMARQLPELLAAGAVMVGGCCGTTPEHIRAFHGILTDRGLRGRTALG